MIRFLLLLAVLQISGPLATVDILRRTMVVSFDNPAAQILDQIALEKPSFSGGSRDADGISRLTIMTATGVARASAPRLARLFVQGELAGRFPPLA